MVAALVLVDIQNDFCSGGALAVPDGDAVVGVANRLMPLFPCTVATQDWHPANHTSFVSNNPTLGIWPDHCVQGTHGAFLHPDLHTEWIRSMFQKGYNPDYDSYSGFKDEGGDSTGLDAWLAGKEISHLFIMGLATDYCVKATVLDALNLGFTVTVIADGCRAVNVKPGDGEMALGEMTAAGALMAPYNSVYTVLDNANMLRWLHRR